MPTSAAEPVPAGISVEPEAIAVPARRARVVFVDVLRLLALAQMINGHTLEAVMVDGLRTGPTFERYTYVRGLVSIAFMVASGLAYHLTTLARWEAHRQDPGARAHRLRRGLLLVGLGYALHAGPDLLSLDPSVFGRGVAALLQLDVLQCIGASILVLETITALARTVTEARLAAVGLALFLLAAAPAGGALPVEPWSRGWVNWVGHQGGSLFPLAPWGAYVLFGAALGGFVVPAGLSGARQVPLRLLAASAVVMLGALLAYRVPVPAGIHDASVPGFVLEKLAIVLGLGAVLALLTGRVRELPRPLRVLASETLSVYVLHCVVVYWLPFGPAQLFPHALGLGPALLASAVMLAVCLGLGLLVPRARQELRARLARPRPALGAGP